jgi:hypothetical protein
MGSAIFNNKTLLGMVHVQALPGTPRGRLNMAAIVTSAVDDAGELMAAGFDGVVIENMHDTPYLVRNVGPEIVAAMSRVACAVRSVVDGILGVQVLAGANMAAVAIAQAARAEFVRAEAMVFAHVADEGVMSADAGALLRYRRAIGAQGVAVLADIKKKHASHALTADVGLGETAQAAAFCGADGVIVTGTATGRSAEVAAVREAGGGGLPVGVGSGLTSENLSDYWPHADVFIVGSALKTAGLWSNALDPGRAAAFVAAARDLH